MPKTEIKMPKVVIFFLLLLFSPLLTNSHAVPMDELSLFDTPQNQIITDSKIIDINSDFFLENNFKRYLIFGSNSLENNILKNNSIHEIQSESWIFLCIYTS